MKKIVLTALLAVATLGLSASANAQGTIWLNNYDSTAGIFKGNGSTAADLGTYVQVLGGASAGSLSAIANTASSTRFTVTDNVGGGFFDVNYGIVNGVGAGATGFFQLIAWSGATDYATALTTPGAWVGASTVWSQAVGTAVPPAPNSPTPATLNIPGNLVMTVVPVPEPSVFALAGLGSAALLLFRRK